MSEDKPKYRAVLSSDWSECLSPSGPFDPISFNHPELSRELDLVFRRYTGNEITLGEASARIRRLLPGPFTPEQMDAYLDEAYITYKGVPDLIEYCLSRDILFMINSTGMAGYFQRVFAKNLLPRVPVVSANPMIRYPSTETDPPCILDLRETQDKARNTQEALRLFGIPKDRIILMGDSGGDGPHFEWGAARGAFLIGSMTKPSLVKYCDEKGIAIDLKFGAAPPQGRNNEPGRGMDVDFMDLAPVIDRVCATAKNG